MAKTTEIPVCGALGTFSNTQYACTLPEGHEDAHENSEFELAWAQAKSA